MLSISIEYIIRLISINIVPIKLLIAIPLKCCVYLNELIYQNREKTFKVNPEEEVFYVCKLKIVIKILNVFIYIIYINFMEKE